MLSNDHNPLFLTYHKIPHHLKHLFLPSHHRNFYHHKPIHFIRLLPPLPSNLKNHPITQRASTITHQLSR
ncbi:transglycosylase domain-containing protein, partial [Bacillus pumilus]|uniref:transglycosylase domain-containing protein n=1 Tax=Bacillus pumilus TaxID=1408 RepID=UPI0034D95E8A